MRGDIRARRIVVEGSVEGNLYALEGVSLRPGTTVRGDIFAAGVAMEDGARLIGRIDMDNAPSVPTVNVAAPGSLEPARQRTDRCNSGQSTDPILIDRSQADPRTHDLRVNGGGEAALVAGC